MSGRAAPLIKPTSGVCGASLWPLLEALGDDPLPLEALNEIPLILVVGDDGLEGCGALRLLTLPRRAIVGLKQQRTTVYAEQQGWLIASLATDLVVSVGITWKPRPLPAEAPRAFGQGGAHCVRIGKENACIR